MIDTKTFKQAFLAGDKDAVMYTDPNEPKVSFYQSTWKGNQVDGDFRATILDKQWQSFAGAPTIPDPSAMSKCIDLDLTGYFFFIGKTQQKFNSIERDRFRQGQKLFGNTGSDFANRRSTGVPGGNQTRTSMEPASRTWTAMNGFRRNNGWIQ